MSKVAEHPLLQGSPFVAYTYAYPHKTAYRRFAEPYSLTDVWSNEPTDALFLYVHVPFCEMRCGFCNLFTLARPREELVARFLAALRRQAGEYAKALDGATFARFAMGGGTPTFLDEAELAETLTIAETLGGRAITSVPSSVETSPSTATDGRLKVLRDFGVSRVSIGVQSFIEAETRASARPQQNAETHSALLRLRAFGFPIVNIDLIYGLPGQTVDSWLASLHSALRYQPEELFLYPLYVRPLTGLGKSRRAWDDLRLECYREARDLLVDAGYEQRSLRMFRARHATIVNGPEYCVQSDGMVGLGCGARSYTQQLHYADDYAVGQQGIATIIDAYANRSSKDFTQINRGFQLNADERNRRSVLLGLLEADGIALDDNAVPLRELIDLGLAEQTGNRLRLTPAGMERSDAIGPWLYSTAVRAQMDAYSWH